jgi:hypothetical protein
MPSETKSISIVVVGSGKQILDVDIVKGSTVRDLLEKLNLSGQLTKGDDPTPFRPNDDLYTRVEDGDKLILTPSTPVATR